MIGGSRSARRRRGRRRDDRRHNPALAWQPAPSLNIGRTHANTVLLPDGSKVEVGGGVGTRRGRACTPTTTAAADRALRPGKRHVEARRLAGRGPRLPLDRRAAPRRARDLGRGQLQRDAAAGADRTDTAEIYSPPYLFKGGRPAISAAPDSVNWGDSFGRSRRQGTKSPDRQALRAVLMAPAATTHGNDMNQRHVELAVTNTVSGGHQRGLPAKRQGGAARLLHAVPAELAGRALGVALGAAGPDGAR